MVNNQRGFLGEDQVHTTHHPSISQHNRITLCNKDGTPDKNQHELRICRYSVGRVRIEDIFWCVSFSKTKKEMLEILASECHQKTQVVIINEGKAKYPVLRESLRELLRRIFPRDVT